MTNIKVYPADIFYILLYSVRYLIEIWSIFSWYPFILPLISSWYPWYPDIRCTDFQQDVTLWDCLHNLYQVSRKCPLNELAALSCWFMPPFLLWRVNRRWRGVSNAFVFFTLHNKNGGLKQRDSAINSFQGHFRDTYQHFVCNPVDYLFKMALKTSNHKCIQGYQIVSFG